MDFEKGYGRGFRYNQYYQLDTLGSATPVNVDTCNCFDGFIKLHIAGTLIAKTAQYPEFDQGKSEFRDYVKIRV